ncbi:uncharacterized protein METZ01_LOCUS469377, partial [marine metagenome]
ASLSRLAFFRFSFSAFSQVLGGV